MTEITALDQPRKAGRKDGQTPLSTAGTWSKEARRSKESPVNRESVSDIVRKHLGVKPDFTMNAGTRNRGYVEFGPDQYRIVLGKDANLSTLIHETGHVFEEELRRLVASGQADERQVADLKTFDKWLSRMDDDAEFKKEYDRWLRKQVYGGRKLEKLSTFEREEARDRAKREYFARGFEAYMREGKAPSEGMRGVFERFKRWLLSVYKHAKELGVDINDEVRGAFDRMLATEMEMDETAAVNELFAKSKAELDKLNVPVADRPFVNGLIQLAKEKAISEVERERKRNKAELIRQWTAEARAELMKDPVYIARSELRKPGRHLNASALIDLLGEDAALDVEC